ncbi:unnamed protein product, partial [Didymodactylos carnosus]
IKRRRAFTYFNLRRKKTNDSLDGLSIQNDPYMNRCTMLSPNYCYASSLRNPNNYLKQLQEMSQNHSSEKSYVWHDIEQKLKHTHKTRYLH